MAGQQTARKTASPARPAPVAHPALAWAGIVGPVLFTAAFLAQDVVRRAEHDAVREPVSALAVGAGGWVQQMSFVVLGVLTMMHAVGLHRVLPPTRAGVLGPAALFVTGVANLLAVVYPLRADEAGTIYDPGGHQLAGMLFFLGTPVALILLALRMRRDLRWHGLARWTLLCGILLVAAAAFMGWLVIPDDAPLHDLAGLFQRLVVVLLVFSPRVAIAVRMLRVSRES